jgi:ubiquinone biosynthesis protein
MNKLQFINLLRMIYGKKKLDINKIQSYGLLAVKLGQTHALRADFLPPEKCQELSKLFRATIKIPREQALSQVDKSKFSSIEEEPLAAASVGQVYRAKLTNNEEVVIKILKADFKRKFEKEVKSIRSLINFSIFFYPKLKRVFDPNGILDHIEEYTLLELDLRKEILGQKTLKDIYEKNKQQPNLKNLRFPKIYPELSSEKVMVSQYLDGKTFDELLNENKLPYEELLELFKIHGFYMFKIGTFHGDIHPGNIMYKDKKIYFMDTGAISHASKNLSDGLLNMFEHLSNWDYTNASLAIHNMSQIKLKKEKLEEYKKEFNKLYKDFKNATVSQISLTKRMMETIKLAVNHGMQFEKEMFPIIKSLMYLDGMVLRCNPQAILLKDMKKFIKDFKK